MAQAMREVSRKDFLRLGGAGLVSAMLPGAAGCNGRQVKVVRFFTGTRETAALEGALTEIHVDRFEEQHPDIDLQREALQPDDVRREIQSRLRSREPPDVFAYDTGPGFGGVLADAGLLRPLENAYKEHGWDSYDKSLMSSRDAERSRSPLETENSTPQVICSAWGPATCLVGKGWMTFSMETVGGILPRSRRQSTSSSGTSWRTLTTRRAQTPSPTTVLTPCSIPVRRP